LERAADAASMTAVQFLQMHRALCLYSDASNVRSSVSVVTRLQTELNGLDSQQDLGVELNGLDSQQDLGVESGILLFAAATK